MAVLRDTPSELTPSENAGGGSAGGRSKSHGGHARVEALIDHLLRARRLRSAARGSAPRLADLRGLVTDARSAELVPLLLARATGLEARLDLLERVFTAGGYETAQALAEQLEADVVRADRRLRRRALPLFTRVFLTIGELHRAEALWERAGEGLSRSQPLREALRLTLDPSAQTKVWAFGTILAYPAATCIQRGELSLRELDAGLRRQPWASLLNPELELLRHNAALPDRDPELCALNRYLARQGLARVQKRAGASGFLESLAFERGPVRRGPLVSVIVSARNAERTVRYAIDSLLGQSYEPLELLIADDGSSDATYAVLREHYQGNARVRLFRSRHNQGTYHVRNQLLAEARGELVTFHDADDLALPSRIAEQVRVSREPGRVGSICEWLRVRPDGSIAFFANGKAIRLSVVSFMATRAALRSVGGYPGAKVGADLDVYRRVLQQHGPGSVGRIPLPLLLGLWGEGSLTRSVLSESLESGYRSPARRRYSELVFRRDVLGPQSLPESALLAELRALDNYREPSALIAEPAAAR